MRTTLTIRIVLSLLGLTAGSLLPAAASDTAGDDASNSPYADGWNNGDDGGFGWSGGWQLGSAPSGNTTFSTGSSTLNGNGDDDANGDIDTPAVGGRSWGIEASGGGLGTASRGFTGTFSVFQTLALTIDTGFIENGGLVEFSLLGPSGTPDLNFGFLGGSANYFLSSSGAGGFSTDTLVPWTDEGLQVSITLTSANTIQADMTPLGGATTTLNETLPGNAAWDHLQLENSNAGAGADHVAYFNDLSLQVIPEPATLILMSAGLLGALSLRRRKARRS